MSKCKRLRIRKMLRMTLLKNTHKWKAETAKATRAMARTGSSNQVLDKPLAHHAFQKVSHNKKVKSYKLSTLVKSLRCQRLMRIKAKELKNKKRQPK